MASVGGSFSVLLDKPQPAKPNVQEIAAITYRLQHAGGVELDAARLCDHIRHGGTFVCATFEPQEPGARGWSKFVQLQLVALDFDNKDALLDPLQSLERCERLSLKPLCLYFTFSCTAEDLRYRLMFDLNAPIKSEQEARAAIKTALALFPEADQSCSNPNRLFFGSNGEVWETWRVWTASQPNIDVLRGHWRRIASEQAHGFVKPTTPPRQRPGTHNSGTSGSAEIREMCSQVDLLQLVQADTGEIGMRSGNRVRFHYCPVCRHFDDLSVWPDSNTYTCFSSSCPWPRNANGNHGGDVLQYLRYARHDGDLIAAVKELRQITGNQYHKRG